MPNGRCGGFPIERDALRRLLEGFAADLHVGSTRDESQRRWTTRKVTVAELGALVDTHCGTMIAVEEQDHSWYIIHIRNIPESVEDVWVVVDGESPLFPVLRQQHEAWVTEHPHDRTWMAF